MTSTHHAAPPAQQNKSDDVQEISHSLAALRKVRDEIKLHIHLAGMEARDRFGSLDAELQELDQARHAAGEGARHLLSRLHSNFQQFRDSLGDTKH